MFTPSIPLDIVAYNNRGEVVLLAEVKSTQKTDAVWAAQFRRNLLSHRTLPDSLFFLIATPEQLYFWKRGDSTADEAPPLVVLDATAALETYFEKFKRSPETISEPLMEWILSYWLDDVVSVGEEALPRDPASTRLINLGFVDALAGAHLQFNTL